MSDNTQQKSNDENTRRVVALALVVFSLLPIGWAAYSLAVLETGIAVVLFPLLIGVAHLVFGGYLYMNTSSSSTEEIEQELDDDFSQ